jgi:hypothetical protein
MNKVSFENAIDLETPIEILDDPTAQAAVEPVVPPVTPEEDTEPKPDPAKDLIEVNVEDGLEGKTEITPDPIGGDPSSSKNTFSVLAKALLEEGVISSFEESEEEFGAKELIKLLEGEINNGVDGYKNSLPEDVKAIIDNYEEGVPLNKLIEAKTQTLEYNKITEEFLLESVDLQRSVVRKNLENKGYSEAKINRRLKQFEELENLEEEAVEALSEDKANAVEHEKEIIKAEKERNRLQAEESTRQMESLKDDVFSTETIIPGITLNDKDKKSIYKSMTEVVAQDESGNPLNSVMETRMKNPLAFEKAVHYYHSLGLFKIDKNGKFTPDFSKINKVSKSSAIDELTKVVGSSRSLSSGQPAREEYNGDKLQSNIKSLREMMAKVRS